MPGCSTAAINPMGKQGRGEGVGALGQSGQSRAHIGLSEKPKSRQSPEGAGSSCDCCKHTEQVQRHWGISENGFKVRKEPRCG